MADLRQSSCAVSATWVIGLDAWIIQDGNYGDFARGERHSFAVEFAPVGLEVVAEKEREARRDSDAAYDVIAHIAYDNGDVWVLDFGLRAYCDQSVPNSVRGERPFAGTEGTFVAGLVALGIDPFSYYERLNRAPGIPELIYTWTIERIERQTAPFKEVAPRVFERDSRRHAWVDVEATNAWDDDGGQAEYLLHCRLVDVPPTLQLVAGAA